MLHRLMAAHMLVLHRQSLVPSVTQEHTGPAPDNSGAVAGCFTVIWLVLECRCHDRRQELPSGLDCVDEEVQTDKLEMRVLLWKLFLTSPFKMS